MTTFFIAVTVLGVFMAYLATGARFGRRFYVEARRRWFDDKIRERRKLLERKGRTEDPEDTLALLRKQWEEGRKGQGEALGLAMFMVISWPIAVPVFRLARDPEPQGEEARLVNASLEAEVERLRRQVEG